MDEENTTAIVERYLNALGEDATREQTIRKLLTRAVRRLRMLCGSMLHKSYTRLTQAPLNLERDELLSAVVERLLKALREVRPATARQFFALANQHMRWELNDLARRLDNQPSPLTLPDVAAPASDSGDSSLTLDGRRMLEAIDNLPPEECEVFSLVRIQGCTQTEVAELLGIASKTVQRRLNRALLLLAERLHDLAPPKANHAESEP